MTAVEFRADGRTTYRPTSPHASRVAADVAVPPEPDQTSNPAGAGARSPVSAAGALMLVPLFGAFAASWTNLADYFVRVGAVGEGLGWLAPLTIDGMILGLTALGWQRARIEATVWQPRAAMAFYVLASVWFNAAHAPPSPASWVAAVMFPIGVFVAFEFLLLDIRTRIETAEAEAEAAAEAEAEAAERAERAARRREQRTRARKAEPERKAEQPEDSGRQPEGSAPEPVSPARNGGAPRNGGRKAGGGTRDQVAGLLAAHLDSGGTADDTPTSAWAEQIGVSPRAVRGHLAALRAQQQEVRP